MKRKNVLALGLALVMSVGMLTGCGGKGSSDAGTTPGVTQGAESTGGTQAEATQGAQAPTEAPEPTAEPTKEATPTPEPTPTEVPDNIPDVTVKSFEVPTNEALQFVKDMKIGWNLGNTFDASECTWLSDELDYESAWCGVKTSARLIQAVKDAGFNTLRLPVSWHNHVSGENHTISEAWLDRVQEVVDMARAADMYVILDIHHDNNTEFLYPSSEYHEQSKHYIKCIWEQLAERFKDYDDKLVFEAMNEPRLVGTNYEWWLNPNDASCKDSVACINELNQLFVDTVRASGGNNATRYLMVPGYCASVDGALNANFILPTDTVENHLIVSVHAYTPYNFALNTKGTAEFDMDKASDVKEITSFMDKIYDKFTSKGIPVIIGEFGAMHKKNLEQRVEFAVVYIANARARGITCCWWDNNAFLGDGELFGLVDRASLKWHFEEVVDALMKYAE